MMRKGKIRMQIKIPELSLVALIGASGSGKTTFAKANFLRSEVLSSDDFRAMIIDDENDQSVSGEAFEMLYAIADKRLSHGKLTVIDATNVQKSSRKEILELAKRQNVHAAAIVLNLPEKELLDRSEKRKDRTIHKGTLSKQYHDLQMSIKKLKQEGFRFIYVLNSIEEIETATIIREKLWNNKKDVHGPFDIIGDIHGCYEELCELLEKLGYKQDEQNGYVHPEGRKAVFVGDLCDRGPQNVNVLKLVMAMTASGNAYAVPGNHDNKLERYLNGRNVQLTNGLATTADELSKESDEFRKTVREYLNSLVSHLVFDDGKLVVSHAGIKENYIGRGSARVRSFCLYGDTTGEVDDLGLPVRLDWAADYRGKATIVYGHVPQAKVWPYNNTYCIDTGCVFGGKLSALRFPEKEIVDVDAHKMYYEPVRPLKEDEDKNDLLNIEDVQGKHYIETRLAHGITVKEENAIPALETMSRFAVDPHWLIYLPPTMSPCETSSLDDYIEYPAEAFDYYKNHGITNIVCEKKHMGSRSVVVLCKDQDSAQNRFHITDGKTGVIYTRTGRSFFADKKIEKQMLERLSKVLTKTGFWDDFSTDWVCLDCELLPWSEKARALIREQYAPTGLAGRKALESTLEILQKVKERNLEKRDGDADIDSLISEFESKKSDIDAYTKAYREYCWSVKSLDDLRLAPFHLLACEGKVFSDKEHLWHMESLRKYVTGIDDLFMATECISLDISKTDDIQKGIDWWLNLTGNGGEGMVVKPEFYTAYDNKKLIQPAIKCRGREYLRIIYGPDYTMPKHLIRLKKRSLSRKRNLAIKEFALGIEALERFVNHEPLNKIHECVFGVLAFETEAVDPRL